MNILIGSNVHWWNAEAAYAATTAELLQKAGHRVYVLTRPNTLNAENLKKRGLSLVTDINLNTLNPLRLYQSYRKLRAFLKTHKIQIVNPHRSEGFFIYILLKHSLQSFKLVRTRGTTRPVRGGWLNHKIYCDWVDNHIFAGQVILSRLLETLPLPSSKQHVIYYPINRPLLPVSVSYHDEFEIPPLSKILAIVGRISPVKGHDLLLKSFQELLQQKPQTVLLILYKHPDPERPQLKRLKEMCKQWGIASHVRFIGPRQDIRTIMKFVDLGVVASLDSEVICRVAVEFFSVGTPVVALATGCLPEIIQDGINGMLVQETKTAALRDALQKLLDDPERLQHLREGALSSAVQHFSQELFLQKTLEVFEKA